jgi:putative AdoMet-dependent methyltransferase
VKDWINRLAISYDQDMAAADQAGVFPYEGYAEVLAYIQRELANTFPIYPIKVLDLGIGTGKLYQNVLPGNIQLTGIDFAESMLEIVAKNHPNATLCAHDLTHGLPEELGNETYDAIVATYLFHSFSLEQMIAYIKVLVRKLTPFGRIYIGDAMFLTSIQKRSKQVLELQSWGEFAHYHVYEQILGRIDAHLAISYAEIQNGAGVLIVENYHECTLQNPEHLVKYGQSQ